MSEIFTLIYLVLVLAVLVAGGFIVFHILRYSIERTAKIAMLTVFMVLLGLLLFLNIWSFFSLRPEEFFEQINLF